MVRLSERELSQVLQVVRDVGRAGSRDEFLRHTLTGVCRLVPCLVATANEVDPVAGRVAYVSEPSSFPIPEGGPALLGELAGEHPLIRHISETGDGSAHRISDFWSREEFHASRLYRQLYRPMGVEYQMSVTLPAPAPLVLGIVVNRGDRDFTERERALLNAVRPHLAQAWRNAAEQERLRGLVDAASGFASARGWGVVVLWDPPDELTPGVLVTLYRLLRPAVPYVSVAGAGAAMGQRTGVPARRRRTARVATAAQHRRRRSPARAALPAGAGHAPRSDHGRARSAPVPSRATWSSSASRRAKPRSCAS